MKEINPDHLDREEIYSWAYGERDEEALALIQALDRRHEEEVEERLLQERRDREIDARERKRARGRREDGREKP